MALLRRQKILCTRVQADSATPGTHSMHRLSAVLRPAKSAKLSSLPAHRRPASHSRLSPCLIFSSYFSSSSSKMGSTLRPNNASTPFKVLVVGGSYSGLAAALNLSDMCLGKTARASVSYQDKVEPVDPIHAEITVVDERDGFYHVIGSPLVFASKTYAEKAWVTYKEIPALQASPNIKTVHGSVTSVDFAAKKATVKAVTDSSSSTIDYDFIIVTSGLRRAYPVVPQSGDKTSYLAEVTPHIESVSNAKDGVLVVGGGAVGIEMAAELKLVQPQTRVILAHSRSRLLSSEPLPDVLAEKTLEILKENGVEVLLSHRLQETKEVEGDPNTKIVSFTNGDSLRVNAVVVAISKSEPSTSFLPVEAINDEGYVKIQPNLFFPKEIPNSDSALAGGDLVDWSGIKRCGRAMHMGYYTALNTHQRMQELVNGKTPEYFTLQKTAPVIALALGDNAIAWGDEVTYGKDIAERFFSNDVGFDICWNILGMGEKPAAKV
ncbi:pyridine nucleotide-disulfide oxidoreductase [Ophiostoma piceae UAMH 11346]|uniref:Pyridine nucleotide-disulfide oxidoreductase n=1 Tax=Ophiostoma piceae (strain UAMH 11346) TaxID=1262450 RepID=S3C437_OPHP1|nr:pyridine nucleotide-disulfide oxidoreductase [Ophiostoma piceae UAMH 11346]